MKRFKGRLLMLFFYLAVTVLYVLFRVKGGVFWDMTSESMLLNIRAVATFFKLITACLLVYLIMLIMRKFQDNAWADKMRSSGAKVSEPDADEGIWFNVFCAVCIILIYVVLMFVGLL